MSDIENYELTVNESKEVWWATTNEYDLEVNGESISVRIAENPKGTEFFQWDEKSGWCDEGIMAIVHEAWTNGELE